MNTPFPQFGGPEMGRPSFGPGFGFAPPSRGGRGDRHDRRELRDHLREQFREHGDRHDGPPGFDPRRGFGPGGFGPSFGPGFGPVGGGRGSRRGHGRGRGKRGDVRAAILKLLAERPMHGYEMIQEIAERTQDLWKPSPGSVYPTLQLLADEGLLVASESDGSKKLFELTDEGRAAADKIETAPWDEITEGADPGQVNIRAAVGQLFGAVRQAAFAANAEQQQRIVDIVNNARREIYQILGESE